MKKLPSQLDLLIKRRVKGGRPSVLFRNKKLYNRRKKHRGKIDVEN